MHWYARVDIEHLGRTIAALFKNNPTLELNGLEIIQKARVSTQLPILLRALNTLVTDKVLKMRKNNGVRLYSLA